MRAGVLAYVGAVMALGAFTPPASAISIVRPDGSADARYQQWVDRAHAPMPHLAAVTVDPAPCPDIGGACTGADHLIFANAALAGGPVNARGGFLHELGHLFDYTAPRLNRARFLRIMRDRRPWRWAPNSPHEQFAEAYALCALGGKLARRYGTGGYAFEPNRKQLKAVCRLIRSSRAG